MESSAEETADREVCWNTFVCRVCAGETQEVSEVAHEIQEFGVFDDSGMAMTMEQIVTQQQQEVFTLKAQVADQSGLADALLAIINHATAQGKKDSLIYVKGLGRPKEISAKKKIFNSGRRRRRQFFTGVITEFEMMLEWSAELAAEITTEFIELEFLPKSSWG